MRKQLGHMSKLLIRKIFFEKIKTRFSQANELHTMEISHQTVSEI